MKTCPRCNSVLFADGDMCFECLYDYNNPNLDYAGSGIRPDPEDEFPLDEPVPIDAYSQDYPSFESDTREPSYSDSFPTYESDEVPTEGTIDEEPTEEVLADEQPAPLQVVVEPKVVSSSTEESDADSSANGQDAGLFAEPTELEEENQSEQKPWTMRVQLGVLVHWRGMEMTTALGEDRLTIGRDRANDITIASFDVPAFAAAIEPSDHGADFTLLAEGIEAKLDGMPIDQTARLGAGQEVDLYGARLSLVRLD